jgi:hypothetical protein
MSKSIKAAMLSAFVFPGAGHFFLKRYLSGIVLAGTAVVPLYFILSVIVEKTLQIADKIQRGEVQLDVAVITELIVRQPTGIDAGLLRFAWIVLIISWLLSIADSYRVGCIQDKSVSNSSLFT